MLSSVSIEQITVTDEQSKLSIEKFSLISQNCELILVNYGASILRLRHRNRHGVMEDIALCPDIDKLINNTSYFGCVAGRVANR